MRYSNFTVEDEKSFVALSEKGLTATYIYTQNVWHNGAAVVHSDKDKSIRTIASSGVSLVPVSFFEKFLGAHVSCDGDKCTISTAAASVTLKAGAREYSVRSENKTYKTAPLSHNGTLYVPEYETVTALGFAAGVFCDGKMVVVADEEKIKALDENEALTSAAAYVIFGEYNPYTLTPADYKAARTRWRDRLVGSERLNDLQSPVVQSKIENADKKCIQYWQTINKNPDAVTLWGDTAPTETAHMNTLYSNVRCMAKGYGTYGSAYYKNQELLADIIYALDWLYEHLYGEAEIEGRGWRSVHIFNWWEWFVGVPENLTDILFILEDEIPLAERKRYLKCFEWLATVKCKGNGWEMTRISVCTKVAIALEEPKYLEQESQDFDYLLTLKRSDYLDYSHGFPYNMAYGILNLDRVMLVASALAGTAVEYSNPQLYVQFGMAKYMFEAAMYCGQGFAMLAGRSISRPGNRNISGEAAIANILPMIGVFGPDEDAYLKKMIKRNSVVERVREDVKNSCSYSMLALYESILKDDTIPYDNDYEYAHAWYTGDRAAQHRNGYAVGIAMSSSRQFTYECINSENKTGWYTGDGAMYLYTTYDDSTYTANNFINNLNLSYRIPGTTEDNRERAIRAIRSGRAWIPSKSFAGAIQFRDKYIVAAMDYESMNFTGEDDLPDDSGYGGGLAVHENDLVSKKAWFCFDNEIISLSAGITSTMNAPVSTTVEHRRIVKDDEFSQLVKANGKVERLPKAELSNTYESPEWVLMEGHAGYVFLEGASVYINRYDYETDRVQPYFEIGISHGKNPTSASYAYAVIPYATPDTLDAYFKAPDVEIISNTDKLQAVREKKLGITGYVFYEAGSCEGIEVSEAVEMVVGDNGATVEFGITDPTHKLETVEIKINGNYEPAELEKTVSFKACDGFATVKVNFNIQNGRPYRFTLKKI